MIKSKRGSENIYMPEVIGIILASIIFFSGVFYIQKVASGASAYEEIYSKKIALILDSAKPGTVAFLNISEPLKIAKKNNYDCTAEIKKCFSVNENKILVRLNSAQTSGVSYAYFSSYSVGLSFDKTAELLVIEVKNE
jgi:hypothetical protein